MKEFKYASVRYCSQLKKNVVFESRYNSIGERECECLCKQMCNYDECGCRNGLFSCVVPALGNGANINVNQA